MFCHSKRMILRIFCDTLACHSERSPAEIPLGFASCFWGKAPKVRQAQDDTCRCPAGRSRNPITVRIKRDLSRLESRKKSVIYGDRAIIDIITSHISIISRRNEKSKHRLICTPKVRHFWSAYQGWCPLYYIITSMSISLQKSFTAST